MKYLSALLLGFTLLLGGCSSSQNTVPPEPIVSPPAAASAPVAPQAEQTDRARSGSVNNKSEPKKSGDDMERLD